MEKILFEQLNKYTNYTKEYEKNQQIFDEGDLCENIGLVIKGEVVISSYSELGNEIVFNLLKEKQIFGQSLIFSSTPFYKGKVIAKEKSKIAYINKESLLQILKDETMMKLYLTTLSDEILKCKEKQRILAYHETSLRLLYYLSIHQKIYCSSISELAKILCVSRESLSRELKSLVLKQKIIRTGKWLEIVK